MDKKAAAKARLSALLARVLEDGRLDDGERAELQGFYSEALLSVSDVREVFGAYLKALQDDVLADGVVTDEERERCRFAVAALKIPRALLSPELARIVG